MRKSISILLVFASFFLMKAQEEITDLIKYEVTELPKTKKGEEDSNARKITEPGFIGYDSTGMPLYFDTFDEGANSTSNIDLVNSTPINGQVHNLQGNGRDIYTWDGSPVSTTHTDLAGRVTQASGQIPYDSNNIHSTTVAGVLAGAGISNSTAIGVLPKANIISYDYDNYATEISSVTGIKLSNHSYGSTAGWRKTSSNVWQYIGDYSVNNQQSNYAGAYTGTTRNYDILAFNTPYHTMVKAAGNSYGRGPVGTELKQYWNGTDWVDFTTEVVPLENCAYGYDCLTTDASAKNLLIVGGNYKMTSRYNSPSDVTHYWLGSVGPRDDGGIKPDITATATSIIAPTSTSDTGYITGGHGTSFSAPIVTGIVGMMQELWEAQEGTNLRSDMVRGIITHTANEAGSNPGPDPIFGWGLADGLQAITAIANNGNTSYINKNVLTLGGTYEKTFVADGTEPLKITLAWIDPPAPADDLETVDNDRTSRIVNDLDIVVQKVTDASLTYPWKLDANNPLSAATKGVNNVDNIEQVLIENPTANAEYKVIITHKGTLDNPAGANFALIATGLKENLSTEDIIGSISKNIMITPNPASSYLFVKLPRKINNTGLNVYGVSGKLVKQYDPIEKESAILDVHSLEKGTYILEITTDLGTFSKPFIKQ
ncbi:MAG: S8 family peptidase [Flavobacteriales bacterium]|nr:S8 family peptidase [Flavobacteriales bacterium]